MLQVVAWVLATAVMLPLAIYATFVSAWMVYTVLLLAAEHIQRLAADFKASAADSAEEGESAEEEDEEGAPGQ